MRNITKVQKKRIRVLFNKQFLKFILFGGLSSVINILSRLIISNNTTIEYNVSITIAYTLGMIFNFVLNRIFTFSNFNRRIDQQARSFIFVALGGLVLVNLSSFLFRIIGQNLFSSIIDLTKIETCSHILSIGIVAIYSFFGHKYISFKSGIRKFFLKKIR